MHGAFMTVTKAEHSPVLPRSVSAHDLTEPSHLQIDCKTAHPPAGARRRWSVTAPPRPGVAVLCGAVVNTSPVYDYRALTGGGWRGATPDQTRPPPVYPPPPAKPAAAGSMLMIAATPIDSRQQRRRRRRRRRRGSGWSAADNDRPGGGGGGEDTAGPADWMEASRIH